MGKNTKKLKLDKQLDMLSTKPTRQPSKTLIGHVPAERTAKTTAKAPSQTNIVQRSKGEDGRALPQELLDNGQGKSTTTSNDDLDDSISTDTGSTASNSDMKAPLIAQVTRGTTSHTRQEQATPTTTTSSAYQSLMPRARLQRGQQRHNCGNKTNFAARKCF